MPPWDSLQIEPTADARAIKKAYARLLKQHRPDQNAAAFQQLHHAYKTALQLAEQQAEAMPASPPPREAEPEQLANWTIQLPPVAQPEPPPEPDPAADYHPLFQRCRELLAEHHGARQPQYWEFLARSPELLDDAIHRQLGQALFDELVRHQRDAQQANCTLTPVSPEVLQHLDALFSWRDHRRELCQNKPVEICEQVFTAIDNCDQQQDVTKGLRGGKMLIRKLHSYSLASPKLRAIAGFIDIFTLSFLLELATHLPAVTSLASPESLKALRLEALFPIYILISSLCEYSRWQASPGKWLLGLRVVDKSYNPLGLKHLCLRALVMSSVPLILVISSKFHRDPHLLFGLLILINAIMQNGVLLQDLLTSSRVINLRLSMQTQKQTSP
jgi:uncharacterized RDD family membrane protein YckC